MNYAAFDREVLFQALSKQRWKEFLKYFKSFKEEIYQDPIAGNAISHFMPQLITAVESHAPELYIEVFEYIYLMYTSGSFKISETDFTIVVTFYLKGLLNIKDYKNLLSIAKLHPDLEISQTVLGLLDKTSESEIIPYSSFD